ncbi:MAG: toll/interleukin-1 receptor domain-containing protein [Phycisphaerae bacterium]|nr:toll/interleukin-1 receptor domain-containing protein [Phycisphaerae bacterium]
MPNKDGQPTAFISYTWESDPHKEWVRTLAARLRGEGVDVKLDQWECHPGDQLPAFMETAIRENDFALIVCTPKYKSKSEQRIGGAGYEGDVMTGEVFTTGNHRKFIPILRSGAWADAAPSWLTAKYRIDLSGEPYSEDQYHDLLDTLHGRRKQAPPVGPVPPPRSIATPQSPTPAPRQRSRIVSGFQTDPRRGDSRRITGSVVSPPIVHRDDDPDNFLPIKIDGFIEDQIGTPKNDGTPGSALYPVSLRLSRKAPARWAELFVHNWDNPSSWSSMHRRGIASVSGDVVTLSRTQLEEVKVHHKDMLKQCLDFANAQYVASLRADRQTADRRAAKDQEWKEHVRKQAGDFRIE